MKKIFSLLLVIISIVFITACGKDEEKEVKKLVMYSGSSSSNYEYTYDYEKNTLVYDSFDTGDTDSIMLDDVDLDKRLNDKINNYKLVDELKDECEGRDGCSTTYILIEYEDGSKKYVSSEDSAKAREEIEPIFIEIIEGGNTDVSTTYELKYDDGGIPGNYYTIYFLSDKSIKVINQPGCSTVECVSGEYTPPEETHTVSFSEEGMEIVWNWANQNFKSDTVNNIYLPDITDNDQIILWAIAYNDESYLWLE